MRLPEITDASQTCNNRQNENLKLDVCVSRTPDQYRFDNALNEGCVGSVEEPALGQSIPNLTLYDRYLIASRLEGLLDLRTQYI